MIGMRMEMRHERLVSCCVCGAQEALEAVRPERVGKMLADGGEVEAVSSSSTWRRINVRSSRRARVMVFYSCSDQCRAKFWTPCVDGSGEDVYVAAPGK